MVHSAADVSNIGSRFVRRIFRTSSVLTSHISSIHTVILLACATLLLASSPVARMATSWMGANFKAEMATDVSPSFFSHEEDLCTTYVCVCWQGTSLVFYATCDRRFLCPYLMSVPLRWMHGDNLVDFHHFPLVSVFLLRCRRTWNLRCTMTVWQQVANGRFKARTKRALGKVRVLFPISPLPLSPSSSWKKKLVGCAHGGWGNSYSACIAIRWSVHTISAAFIARASSRPFLSIVASQHFRMQRFGFLHGPISCAWAHSLIYFLVCKLRPSWWFAICWPPPILLFHYPIYVHAAGSVPSVGR